MHALALCQILWFVHRLATGTIICAIAFIIAPAQTLGTIIQSLKKCAAGCARDFKKCTMSCKSATLPFVIACSVGLIFTVTLLFLALVENGLQSAGLGEFILSLVPSTAIFVIGLCVNRDKATNFYRKMIASSGTTGSNVDTPTNGDVQDNQISIAMEDKISEEKHW